MIFKAKNCTFIDRSLWLFLVCYCLAGRAYGADYQLVAIDHSAVQQLGMRVLPLIYKELGLSIQMTSMEGRRAQLESSSGLKDGEVLRIWSYGEEFSNTIRVPTPLYELQTIAFIRKGSGITINHIDDLKNYRLVKVSGVRHTHDITRGMDNVVDVRTPMAMMRYLDKERADIALSSRLDGDYAIQQLGLDTIESVTQPLNRLPLYHYLYKDHGDLAKKLNEVIKKAQSSGQLHAWIKEAEALVIASNSLRQ